MIAISLQKKAPHLSDQLPSDGSKLLQEPHKAPLGERRVGVM